MYFHTPLLAKSSIISIVFVSLLTFLVQNYINVFTISLKFLQKNILGAPFKVKVIISIIFYIHFFFLKKHLCQQTLQNAPN